MKQQPRFISAQLLESAPERPWTDLQRLALAMGVLPASVLYGFFYVTADSLVDRTGQAVVSVVAMVLLSLLARRVHRRIVSDEVSVRLTASQNL